MWMSSLRPDQIHFHTECCTATTKEGRGECNIRDIGSRSRKEVWEFVDVVSGSSFKASENSKTACKCRIKYMILSV